MFYGASPFQFRKADALRQNLTKAERLLWSRLRNKQILGFRFKSQHPIAAYVADFYCHKVKLVIEVDGKNHELQQQGLHDKIRSEEMNGLKLTIIRFTNREVEDNLDKVVNIIEEQTRILVTRSLK